MALDAHDVVTKFAPALARIAASYERNPALRDELVQEVLMTVVAALPRLMHAGKLKPFLFRIAHNRCLTHVTRRIRERDREQSLEMDAAADAGDQEQVLIEHERGARLLEAVRRLSLPYRQVITLVLEDLSYEEIAETLGITVANVGVRVNRAKQQLKVLLDHDR